jgi:DUF1680 family protein
LLIPLPSIPSNIGRFDAGKSLTKPIAYGLALHTTSASQYLQSLPRIRRRVTFRTVSYHLWDNRGKTKMIVWIKAVS